MPQILYLLEIVIKNLVVISVLMLFVAYITLAERKMLGYLQVRPGPNRVGWWGLLQPIADGIKSFVKEDIIPADADKPVYLLAPMISFFTALSMFAVIPFGDRVVLFGREIKLVIADVDIGILYVFALATLGEYGVVLGGWASGNKYGLWGALRAAAQMISYELPLGIALLAVVLLTGSLNLRQIVEFQATLPLVALQPVGFLIFFSEDVTIG